MRTFVCAATAATALLFGAATGASAQEPGVTLDPGSPSGKQYEIPLETARGQVQPPKAKPKAEESAPSGSDSQVPAPATQERSTPLFGDGVEGEDPTSQGQSAPDENQAKQDNDDGTGKAKRKSDRDERDAAGTTTPQESESEDSRELAAAAAATSGGGNDDGGVGGTVIVVAVGALLLAVAAGAGLLFRRRGASLTPEARP